jgi:hypothetical protein
MQTDVFVVFSWRALFEADHNTMKARKCCVSKRARVTKARGGRYAVRKQSKRALKGGISFGAFGKLASAAGRKLGTAASAARGAVTKALSRAAPKSVQAVAKQSGSVSDAILGLAKRDLDKRVAAVVGRQGDDIMRGLRASSEAFARRGARAAPLEQAAQRIAAQIQAAPGRAQALLSEAVEQGTKRVSAVAKQAAKRAPAAKTWTQRGIRIARRAAPRGSLTRQGLDVLQTAVAPGPMQRAREIGMRVVTGQPEALTRAQSVARKAASFAARHKKAIGTTAGLAALTGLYESAQARQAAEKAREHELLMEALRMRNVATPGPSGGRMLLY